MSRNQQTRAIKSLQSDLEAAASADKKDWWERYLRGAVSFRGVAMPDIRAVVAAWHAREGVGDLAATEQFALAMKLLEQPTAEDKLAAVVFVQAHLLDEVNWIAALDGYESAFERNLIFDWNTCDWFCVRVLGPTIEANGSACAKRVSDWRSADNLWQARAAVVGFVNIAGEKRFRRDLLRSCKVVIAREERFAKTGVGWVLHEVWKQDRTTVTEFIDGNLEHFSFESLRNALKYAPERTRERYLRRFKNL